MDATDAGGGKPAQPAASINADADADADAALSSDPAASVDIVAGKAGGDEDEESNDDEQQMERFYALLANIRGLRGAYVAGSDTEGGHRSGAETAGGGARKRLRSNEPPWRPVFRMEDFEEPSPTSSNAVQCTKRKQGTDAGDEGSREPAAASPTSSSLPDVATRFDNNKKN